MTNKSTSADTLRKNRNNNGRPKLPMSEKKNYKVTVKFATSEYYSLKSKTRQAGMTISEFIRLAIQSCSVKERLNPSHVKHISQLSGMADNLNQIAKRANQVGYVAVRHEHNSLIKEIDNVIKTIENDG